MTPPALPPATRRPLGRRRGRGASNPAKPAYGASLWPSNAVLAHRYGQSNKGGSQPSPSHPLGVLPYSVGTEAPGGSCRSTHRLGDQHTHHRTRAHTSTRCISSTRPPSILTLQHFNVPLFAACLPPWPLLAPWPRWTLSPTLQMKLNLWCSPFRLPSWRSPWEVRGSHPPAWGVEWGNSIRGWRRAPTGIFLPVPCGQTDRCRGGQPSVVAPAHGQLYGRDIHRPRGQAGGGGSMKMMPVGVANTIGTVLHPAHWPQV